MQSNLFMEELIRLYGDLRDAVNRARAYPNSGVATRAEFDAMCAAYYASLAPKQEGKRK